eukprot:NODE_17834_length_923_cov_15.129397.p1 GENE.NODE_17834_length_923_cov_15.129397~~NODE_17834_length_923_cov_15.129397.p1  ORF type:complete len:237 (+),score=31.74 NODE_17834_length_923_cov_15.129397:3-713(+)
MEALIKSPDDIISINAGGANFQARRSTLCQVESSMLAVMFSGRWDKSIMYDNEGSVFIETSPPVFEAVLSHLRTLSLDTHAEPPDITLSLRPELEAFREFMLLGNVSYPSVSEQMAYSIVDQSGFAIHRGPDMAYPPTLIMLHDGAMLGFCFPKPCSVLGITLTSDAEHYECEVSCGDAVLGRGRWTTGGWGLCRETHLLTFGERRRVRRKDVLIAKFYIIGEGCVGGCQFEVTFF